MSTSAEIPRTLEDRVVLKLRIDRAYDDFVRDGQIVPTLSLIAKALHIDPSEISILSIRSGCTIVVVALQENQREMVQQFLAQINKGRLAEEIEGLDPSEIEMANRIQKGDSKDVIEAPMISRRSSYADLKFRPDLSWLHLSDPLIGDDYLDRGSNTRAELDCFLEALPECLRAAELAPDAVFVTGDIAQSGLPEQYDAAAGFFGELRNSLPDDAKNSPFIVVPGDHDVCWDGIDPELETDMRKRVQAGDDYETMAAEYRAYIRRRHQNYRDFAEKLNGPTCRWVEGYAFSYSFFASQNMKVGIAGYNSAWLSTRKNHDLPIPDLDLQYLVLGASQLQEAKSSLHDADVRLALVHHAPCSEWYRADDRELQQQELRYFDFVLRGSQREPQDRQKPLLGAVGGAVALAGGTLRPRPHHYRGFSAVELDFGANLMRVTAWTAAGEKPGWQLAYNFGTGGRGVRILPERLINSKPDEPFGQVG